MPNGTGDRWQFVRRARLYRPSCSSRIQASTATTWAFARGALRSRTLRSGLVGNQTLPSIARLVPRARLTTAAHLPRPASCNSHRAASHGNVSRSTLPGRTLPAREAIASLPRDCRSSCLRLCLVMALWSFFFCVFWGGFRRAVEPDARDRGLGQAMVRQFVFTPRAPRWGLCDKAGEC